MRTPYTQSEPGLRLLAQAELLLAPGKDGTQPRWTQLNDAVDSNGRATPVLNTDVCARCLHGAIVAAGLMTNRPEAESCNDKLPGYENIYDAIIERLALQNSELLDSSELRWEREYPSQLARFWNDQPERRVQEVLEVLYSAYNARYKLTQERTGADAHAR